MTCLELYLLLSLFRDKTLTKRNLLGKEVIWPTTLDHNTALRKDRPWNEAEAIEECLLLAYLSRLPQPAF